MFRVARADGQEQYLQVMRNVLPTAIDKKLVFDLKGSTVGRARRDGESVQKDVDFKLLGVSLDKSTIERHCEWREQLVRDAKFLE